ncbi:hypothetical protein LX16_2470 [Stackebrandtia albiflava]|uniref:Uncharacterized protein n=1 Tax=Stackebrandtia albiflava TaxID=406432 RepID=A0A562V1F1_9ACTN|nr:hypothetical protein LX16_2470 [Stackebrandtia albiflava]
MALELTDAMRSARAVTYLKRLQRELSAYDIIAVREFSAAVAAQPVQ